MFQWLQRHSIGGSIAGGLLAGVAALLAGIAGLPEPYAVVAGISIAMPVLLLAGFGRVVDADALLGIGVAALVGSVTTGIATRAGIGGSLLVGVAVAGAFVGGYGALARRTRPYHRAPEG